ncbi:tRNA (adenosine(37)-N6)-threonylcarbamoyltransferase complex dimerization subunit type 1 TsaB [Alterisphingorhabdus coralli]|uniref:tRNA (Adenosine(37)-N6)-threonylcarbamoyltransferase complex dimerization subunit type 1 TsaB n=1 Tax=Alterisphingorhabdus coralli TaxID=3071408 RepID=A0AA97FBN1_9SPHN|nr:tRNA (adenosine(37)-N6)-threonylcarbamoyltransferase complex dimerization subunit type 1 TsaB [Parasphingorhabdus sp. SCSIO 66989]WOE76090.1 tRNA (adenosine(37)-N6)-threonylcarbamoyltransferase complex dimerization subunit type 1 TsaB [Parasphingorhabdus sp. SCSIO 66989]
MARLLVIDTATPACSVALFDNEALIASDYVDLGRGHAERLVPMIATLPDKGRADAIAVNCGPGSFTGIRVGLSAAMALGIAWDVPVSGYSSLALVAHMAARAIDSRTISIAMQAGHGELFVQDFQIVDQCASAAPDTDIVSVTPQVAAGMIGGNPVFGSGLSLLPEAMRPNETHSLLPDARAFPASQPDFAALAPKPIYVRAPDAKPFKAKTGLTGAANG